MILFLQNILQQPQMQLLLFFYSKIEDCDLNVLQYLFCGIATYSSAIFRKHFDILDFLCWKLELEFVFLQCLKQGQLLWKKTWCKNQWEWHCAFADRVHYVCTVCCIMEMCVEKTGIDPWGSLPVTSLKDVNVFIVSKWDHFCVSVKTARGVEKLKIIHLDTVQVKCPPHWQQPSYEAYFRWETPPLSRMVVLITGGHLITLFLLLCLTQICPFSWGLSRSIMYIMKSK